MKFKRESTYRRRKYTTHVRNSHTNRHWCFEYIRSNDALVATSGLGGKLIAHLNIETQVTRRLGRFFKNLKERQRERRNQRRADNAIIDELAACPSSEISDMGSNYEDYDVHEEAVRTGRAMIADVESDFDLRLQKKVFQLFQPKKKGKRRLIKIRDVWDTMYEEHMVKKTRMWRTRAALKRERQMQRGRLMAFFKKILTHGRNKIVLGKIEFYLCLLLYEFNMSQLVCFGNAFNQGGVGATVVINILVSVLIQMPFNMWIITMVSYSGSLSLRLFADCMPLVSAIRYPVFFAFIIAESRRLLNYEVVARFTYLALAHDLEWHHCEDADKFCVPMDTRTEHNVNCTTPRQRGPRYEFFATQYYVQRRLFMIGEVGEELRADAPYWGDPLSKYYGPALGIVSFIIASYGIAILKRVTIKVQIGVIVLSAFCVLTVAKNHVIYFSEFKYDYANVNMKSVINFVSLSLQTNGLPILMWLASMKPPALTPARCCVILQGLKFVILAIVGITYSTLAYDIARRYRMTNVACFTLEGLDLVFAIVPDFFSTFRFSTIWQLSWLLCMLLLSVVYSVYMIIAAADSLIQIMPRGEAFATLLMFLVTVAVIGVRLINEFPYFYQALITFEFRGLTYINNFNFAMVVFCIYFLYKPVRLRHEYEFLYGSPPGQFWIVSWHYMVYVAVIVTILTLVDLVRMQTRVPVQHLLAGLFIGSALWLLFFTCIKLAYFGIKNKNAGDLCFPTRRWGPPSQARRWELRRLERTQRQRMRFYCRHKCFINSDRFDDLNEKQNNALVKIEKMRTTAVFSWFIRETTLKEETVQFYNASITEEY